MEISSIHLPFTSQLTSTTFKLSQWYRARGKGLNYRKWMERRMEGVQGLVSMSVHPVAVILSSSVCWWKNLWLHILATTSNLEEKMFRTSMCVFYSLICHFTQGNNRFFTTWCNYFVIWFGVCEYFNLISKLFTWFISWLFAPFLGRRVVKTVALHSMIACKNGHAVHIFSRRHIFVPEMSQILMVLGFDLVILPYIIMKIN